MSFEEIAKIFNANPTNKFIYEHLDEKTIDIILEILEKLDANEFKEINPQASFTFDDIPIPYDKLKGEKTSDVTFSEEIEEKLSELFFKINHEGTNVEYSYAFAGRPNKQKTYSKMKQMGKGKKQTCSYDWKWIEEYIKKCPDNINLALFHTHPNPLNKQFVTLYNKHPKLFDSLGVKSNGLNLSLADIFATIYLDSLIKKYNKNITSQSSVLMYDGNLITFSTANGVRIESLQKIECFQTTENFSV